MNNHAPDITYFCELEAQPLQKLFQDAEILSFLQTTQAAVSLGIIDLSAERAEVVRRLNDSGVPVSAWLLLPKDQGYWFNLDNYPQAAARYAQFQAWSQENGLRWARIGLDIEPDFRALQTFKTNRLAALQQLTQTTFNRGRYAQGRRAYNALIRQIHADGYLVETYQVPLIIDERKARSQVIQRMAGVVDLPEADREVLMVYSSYMRPWGQGILWSYGPQAQGVAVGVTGGGVDMEGVLDTRPLNWAELQTDLLLSYQHSDHIYIFSLEGCVRQNFLTQLCGFDWSQPVQIPYDAALRAESYRSVFQRGLWFAARPAWLLFGMALAVSAVTFLTKGKRR